VNFVFAESEFSLKPSYLESQKEGTNQNWIDVCNIVELLSSSRVQVWRDDSTKDYYRAYDFLDLRHKEKP